MIVISVAIDQFLYTERNLRDTRYMISMKSESKEMFRFRRCIGIKEVDGFSTRLG